jgi:hypothetical protein
MPDRLTQAPVQHDRTNSVGGGFGDIYGHKACDEYAPSESLVVGRKKALLTGICGSKTASKDYSKLRGSHNNVFSVRDLLIDWYD